MFIGETEVRYVLDFLCQDVDRGDMTPTCKSTLKKWIQAYDLQEDYPKLWEYVSTGS